MNRLALMLGTDCNDAVSMVTLKSSALIARAEHVLDQTGAVA